MDPFGSSEGDNTEEVQPLNGRRRLWKKSPTKPKRSEEEAAISRETSPKRKRLRKLVEEIISSEDEIGSETLVMDSEDEAKLGLGHGAAEGEGTEELVEESAGEAEDPLPVELQGFMEHDDVNSVLSLLLSSIGASVLSADDGDENAVGEDTSDLSLDQLLYAAVQYGSNRILDALLTLPSDVSTWKAALQQNRILRGKSDLLIGLGADDRFMFTLMTDAGVLVEYDVGSVTTPLHTALSQRKLEMQALICQRCPEFAIACLAAQNPEDSADCMLHALASAGDCESIVTCLCALQRQPVPTDLSKLKAITDPALLSLTATTDSEGSSCLHWAVEEGHLEVVRVLLRLNPALLSQPDTNGTTPLHSAAVMGRTGACTLLVEQGADVCAKDSGGWIPLLYSLLRDEVSTSMGLMQISRSHTVSQLRALATLLNDRAAYLQQEPQLREVLEKLAIVPAFSAMFNKILQQEHGVLEEMRAFLQSYPFLMDLGTKLACMGSILSQEAGTFMFTAAQAYVGAVRISRANPWLSFVRYLRRQTDAQGREIAHTRTFPALPEGLSHEALIFRNNFLLQFQEEEGVGPGVDREAIESVARDLVQGQGALFTQTEDHESYQPRPISADLLQGYGSVAEYLENFEDVLVRVPKIDPGFTFFGGLIGHLLLRAAASVWHEGELGSQALLNVNLNPCFWRLILNQQHNELEDLANFDASLYQNLKWLLQNDGAEDLALTFSVNNPSNPAQVLPLKPQGEEIAVTDENKHEYTQLVTQFHLKVRMGCQATLIRDGLFATLTRECAGLFNEREVALLLAGSPKVDVEDWKAHATYTGYNEDDLQVEWLWKLISELGDEERSLLLRFATGASRAPPTGFRGMSPRFNVTAVAYSESEALPRASTCFSMLKLPRYPTETLLRKNVMIAIRHGTEGFSFL